MEPAVHYVMTADGVRIAYTVTGNRPPILFCSELVSSHVQLEWSQPVMGPLLSEFARYNTLIRFDPRGSGLSDRVLGQTLDEFVLDIEAVVGRTASANSLWSPSSWGRLRPSRSRRVMPSKYLGLPSGMGSRAWPTS